MQPDIPPGPPPPTPGSPYSTAPYPPAGYVLQSRPASNGKAIASMVLGIVGVVAWWLAGISLVLGLVGLPLGVSARRRFPSGMATAGIVLGIISIVFGAMYWIVVVIEVATSQS